MRPRRIRLSQLMSPETANFSGRVHGGAIMRMMDQAAYACSRKYTDTYMITRSVSHISFLSFIDVGELAHIESEIVFVGKTSLDVKIEIYAEIIGSESLRKTNSAIFTMISVNDENQPMEISPFLPQSEKEKKEWKLAEFRREQLKDYSSFSKA